MYRAHFGLREPPFGLTPDTSFAFSCTSHQAALNTLLVAVASGEGFIKITGEVGTGKTLLCRRFLASAEETCATAYIPNPALEPRALLLALAEELGLGIEASGEQHQLLKRLNHALLDVARDGKRVVVCLDEAQAIPFDTLEALRLLSNLETEKRKLLQVVMFGQPELDARLREESVRQLRQRITFEYRLRALSKREVELYLAHRPRVAGYSGARLFSPTAVRAVYRYTRGVPRLINIVANKALMVAFGEGSYEVRRRHVLQAASDTPSTRTARRWWWSTVAPAAACIGMGAYWWIGKL
jgi:MSHA biogenesis protein MshM